MIKVYRVPLKKVFNRRPFNIATWAEIYGHVKCIRCKQHFKEGDPYIVVVHYKPVAGGSSKMPIHKYQHAEECEAKDVKIQNRNRKPKNVQRLRNKTGRLQNLPPEPVGKPVRTKKSLKK